MPKHTDQFAARAAAEDIVGDMVTAAKNGEDIDVPGGLRTQFPVAEFERSTSRVKGEVVHLRRLHLIGEWQVDPTATANATRTTT